jgi:hypothetical protein
MKYTIEMNSGAITYIPGYIKTGSGIQKLRGFTNSMEIA